jgi:hypothetical protein
MAGTVPGGDDVLVKSYRYVRLAMVGLLIALAVAVGYQSLRQGFLLSSVSAYYYTPAQAIVVGALVGLGVCMVALKGTHWVEDVALNIGGALAAVVAIVPTSRGEDFAAAVRACEESGSPLLTQRSVSALDCPTVQALAEAARANVENNMVALLTLGLLAIAAGAAFLWRDRRAAPHRAMVVWGFGTALATWLSAAVALWVSVEWFLDHAHPIAACGLVVSVLVVALVNARRHQDGQRAVPLGELLSPPRDRYTWIAAAMVVVSAVLIVLEVTDVVSLFWVEITVAAFFAVFWTVQTVEIERWPDPPAQRAAGGAGTPAVGSTR